MKKYLQISIVLILVFLSSTAAFAQKTTRITFYKKATEATVSSSLRSYKDKKVFVIKVRPGQTLKTEQISTVSSSHNITVSVTNPAGEEVGDSDASCNNRREIAPTVAGDYKITVYECQKSDAWRGQFKLKVSVK